MARRKASTSRSSAARSSAARSSATRSSKSRTLAADNRLKGHQTAYAADALTAAAECLRILAHPVRLRMVQLLLHGRYTVGELAADTNVADNVASEHLRLMQRCGFFTSEREGRRVYYRIAEPHLADIMACVERRFLDAVRQPG